MFLGIFSFITSLPLLYESSILFIGIFSSISSLISSSKAFIISPFIEIFISWISTLTSFFFTYTSDKLKSKKVISFKSLFKLIITLSFSE